jgi:hypothetical protein
MNRARVNARRVPDDVQDYIFKVRIAVMAVRVPAGGTQINLHVAGARRRVADLNHRAAKIRAAFKADKSGMKHPDNFSVSGFEPVTPQALVLPDGLEQAFGGRLIFVAQGRGRRQLRPPVGVEIFSCGEHVPDFLRRRPVKVKPPDKILHASNSGMDC